MKKTSILLRKPQKILEPKIGVFIVSQKQEGGFILLGWQDKEREYPYTGASKFSSCVCFLSRLCEWWDMKTGAKYIFI